MNRKRCPINLLIDNGSQINSWLGEIIAIDMFQGENLDIGITILEKTPVGTRSFERDGKVYSSGSHITMEATQGIAQGVVIQGLRGRVLYTTLLCI